MVVVEGFGWEDVYKMVWGAAKLAGWIEENIVYDGGRRGNCLTFARDVEARRYLERRSMCKNITECTSYESRTVTTYLPILLPPLGLLATL